MPIDIEAILARAQAKAKESAEKHKQALFRDKKHRSQLIADNKTKRDIETRKVIRRAGIDKAELLLQECAPIIIEHIARDVLDSSKQKKRNLDFDGIRVVLRLSKTDSGAFSASIYATGDAPGKPTRNYPAGAMQSLAEKQGWSNQRLIDVLRKDDRTIDEDGNLLGFNCPSRTEMLEEIIRLRSRVNLLEDNLATAKIPPRLCKACNTAMDVGESGEVCIECNLKGRA